MGNSIGSESREGGIEAIEAAAAAFNNTILTLNSANSIFLLLLKTSHISSAAFIYLSLDGALTTYGRGRNGVNLHACSIRGNFDNAAITARGQEWLVTYIWTILSN